MSRTACGADGAAGAAGAGGTAGDDDDDSDDDDDAVDVNARAAVYTPHQSPYSIIHSTIRLLTLITPGTRCWR
jgi:hypothetical protein